LNIGTFRNIAVIAALSVFILGGCTRDKIELAVPIPSQSSSVAEQQATEDSEASAKPEDREPGSKGFLWKISGGKNAGYLAGTIHVARAGMYPLDPDLEEAIEESDYIALELDLTKVDQKETLALVNEKALLTDGSTLKDHVAEEDYGKFMSILKKSLLGAGASTFDRYEPWYAAMTLESLPAMKYMLNDGIDQYIAKQAHKNGKTVIELESMESQIGIFDEFSDELQRFYFHQTVENAGLGEIGIKQLLDMWTLGNLELLETMHVEYEKEGKKTMGKLFEGYNDKFLVNRNVEMADRIDGLLTDGDAGTYLVAVGSLHMVGEQGLVSLLEKEGYTVEFVE
jgi:uncharacterized protein YbaP (TraB family)